MSVLIAAAGSGTRVGGQPKAFLLFGTKTFFEHAVETAGLVADEIIVGLAATELDRGRELVGDRAMIVEGGSTRQDTIRRMTEAATSSIIVVHDVARPYATVTLFQSVLTHLKRGVACVPVWRVPVRDSICTCAGGYVGELVDRQSLLAIQTPQAFDAVVLRKVLKYGQNNRTSLVALLREANYPVRTIDGEETNTKVTYSADLDILPHAVVTAD